ncbi:hypothetical protein EWM62_18405 [Mucilaginibacter terrigena]|uniref:Uncharacterized protein n=1 Tax=Mucilaginibacter terrigena TaxID=2492395 RepID=A0A4Q5LIT5_9SPHI|nr:hypothetical protein [Mucilaginibacter terrigena]RYU86178.1 hypothetical protein EWM62_18405 [Mucilaginibacter terrigena]
MQTTYRLKAKELSLDFLESLKSMFTGQELEITVKSVNNKTPVKNKKKLLQMIEANSNNAPVISPDIDIRTLIDASQNPGSI